MTAGPNEPLAGLPRTNRRPPGAFERLFEWACACATWFGLGVLVVLLLGVLWKGGGWVTWSFLTSYDSRDPHKAGILAGIWGSFWLVSLATLLAVPVGVGAALFLEEYGKKGWLRTLIEINLSNLAGVPSIVYGILGMAVFVKMFGIFQSHPKVLEIWLPFTNIIIPLPFGRTVLAGAFDAGPLDSAHRDRRRPRIAAGRSAVAASCVVCVRGHPLADGQAPGSSGGDARHCDGRHPGGFASDRETAPLLMVGAAVFVATTPGGIESPVDVLRRPSGVLEAPFDPFTALPIQIFNWVSRPEPAYQHVAAAAILVLLALLQAFNITASIVRARMRQRARW